MQSAVVCRVGKFHSVIVGTHNPNCILKLKCMRMLFKLFEEEEKDHSTNFSFFLEGGLCSVKHSYIACFLP